MTLITIDIDAADTDINHDGKLTIEEKVCECECFKYEEDSMVAHLRIDLF